MLPGAEPLSFGLSYPCFYDAVESTPFDAHYLYQAVWAASKIEQSGVETHIDVGSDIRFVSQLTTHLSTIFVDIRPAVVLLDRFTCVSGDLLALPFKTQSIQSVSCLHVAEHVGLGRYGDALNPQGTYLACRELARVLAPGGHLYFSLPVGKPGLYFNAHRVHAPAQVCAYFHDLKLFEFSLVDDLGHYHQNCSLEKADDARYACGLFSFQAK
jgi:SAM-dependent methyltransferase